MPKPRVNDTELDKIARFERIKKAITALEKQLAQISKQGDLAPEGSWVARYNNSSINWFCCNGSILLRLKPLKRLRILFIKTPPNQMILDSGF
jgi:hypothetical protein